MTEGAEKSVEELLEEAAVATAAATPPKAKKPRTPKTDAGTAEPKQYAQLNEDGTRQLDDEGNPVMGPNKPAKAKKEGKIYPQANPDGTEAKNEDGTSVMGPYATRYKAPKAPKAPRLDADGNPIVRVSNVFLGSQVLNKVEGKGAGYREGSKRKSFFDLVTPGITVEGYYAAAGGKSVGHTYLVWYINEDQSVSIE